MVSGTAGCSWQNWGSILQDNGWWSTVTESAPEASFAVAGGIEGENGQIGTMQFNPLAGVGLVFTKKLENQPEKSRNICRCLTQFPETLHGTRQKSGESKGKPLSMMKTETVSSQKPTLPKMHE